MQQQAGMDPPGGKHGRRTWQLRGFQAQQRFGHKTHLQKPHNAGSRPDARFFNTLLKSSAVAAQPGEWVQQALVAGCTKAILAVADQVRGGLEGLVAEGAFFALRLGPACVSLFVSDAFTFHGPAFHTSVFSDHGLVIYKPHARRRRHPPRPFISIDCRLLSNASAVVRTSTLRSEISIIVKSRLRL
jgi:hypothetical protein